MHTKRWVWRHWQLLLPAVLAPVVETALLLTVGPKSSAPLGPQATAPAPFDIFHDLRWISVYHNAWWALALELVAALFLRSLYVAWLVQRSWPKPDPPSIRRAVPRIMAFYAVAALVLYPFVLLLFGLAVTHVSYLFFVALPPALAIALIIHRGAAAQAAGMWWRWGPDWRSMGWLAAAFLWLTLAGGLVAAMPLPVAVIAAGAAGFLNAVAVHRTVQRMVLQADRPRRWSHRLVPVTVLTTFAVVVGGAAAGFAVIRPHPPFTAAPAIPAHGRGRPVLVAAGFNSWWSSQPPLDLPASYVGWRYSYRGLDATNRPLPYGPNDTLQPIRESARQMARQVDALYGAYGHPVTIVAESEGALVARTYLLTRYSPAGHEVDRLVILDMPAGEPSVYYPQRGREGWGVGSGWALRGLGGVVRGISPLEVTADAPFLRDLVDCRVLTGEVATAPAPAGVRQISFRALADAVDGSYPVGLPSAQTYVVTATHGGLVQDRNVQAVISAILRGRGEPRSRSDGLAVARVVAVLSDAWHVPELAPDLLPASAC